MYAARIINIVISFDLLWADLRFHFISFIFLSKEYLECKGQQFYSTSQNKLPINLNKT